MRNARVCTCCVTHCHVLVDFNRRLAILAQGPKGYNKSPSALELRGLPGKGLSEPASTFVELCAERLSSVAACPRRFDDTCPREQHDRAYGG